ncbi:zinc ribbon domain-containing protein [Paucisalibacillus sp. EB02]|uniref:zinc ribbon domain-containing protein n=1 Tax=Paucisalibacillus sp. EB02 TaxID=1347087 RepID=UPI0004BB8531|nr:zinc ribbon domain-containing protein [Paucisalibacillus sp. EB02]
MVKYCKECGGELAESAKKFCKHCGASLEQDSPVVRSETDVKQKERKKLTTKQKVIYGIVAAVVVLASGFFVWGKSYTSPEKTMERFIDALVEDDYEKLQKLVLVENKSITEEEAKAVVLLDNKDYGYIDLDFKTTKEFYEYNSLLDIEKNGKWLGVFDSYRISLEPQYIELYFPFEGVEVTFNGKEYKPSEQDGLMVVYGPFAPGVYDIDSNFKGDYTEVDSKDSISLVNGYSVHDINLEADYVFLQLDNYTNIPITNAYIEVNDQQVPFNEDFYIEGFGPVSLDGTTEVKPVIETEWGTINYDTIKLEESYHSIEVNSVPEQITTSVSDSILLYGEDYVKAHAAYDVALFTNITDRLGDIFTSNFDYYRDYEELFSGQLDSVEIDFNNFYFNDETSATVPAKFYFTADFYDSGEKAETEERIDHCYIELNYDKENKTWLINACEEVWYSDDFEATKTLEGSKELHQSNVTTVSKTDTVSTDLISQVTEEYVYQLVEAINSNDYDKVRPYIKDGSALDDMQQDLVARLNDNGVTQEVISVSITNIEEDGENWIVTTNEEIKVIYESGEEETNDYVWKYTAVQDGDDVVLVNIEE